MITLQDKVLKVEKNINLLLDTLENLKKDNYRLQKENEGLTNLVEELETKINKIDNAKIEDYKNSIDTYVQLIDHTLENLKKI